MENVEIYKNDIDFIKKSMTELEGLMDIFAEHKDDPYWENDIPYIIRTLDFLINMLKDKISQETDDSAEMAALRADLPFISKKMTFIKAKHAVYYFIK